MNSVENANSQSHERLREINHLLPLRSNRQPCHGQIGFLERKDSREDQDPEPGKATGQGEQQSHARGHPLLEDGCPIFLGWGAFAVGQNPGSVETVGVLLVMSTDLDSAPASLCPCGFCSKPCSDTLQSLTHLVLRTVFPIFPFLTWAFLSLYLQVGKAQMFPVGSPLC